VISRTRLRQVLMLGLLAGYYAIEQPTAMAQSEFCDQICWSGAYCGEGCYDEANQTYTDCWGYSGGNCSYEYCYPSANWVEVSRVQIGRNTECCDWWPIILGSIYCAEYYSVHAVNLCAGVGERDFCLKQRAPDAHCHDADWGTTCTANSNDCWPGNDCR